MIVAYCSEMSIDYDDMLNITWLEFDYISKGYEQRQQRQWDMVRTLMANQINASGFSKKTVKPSDMITLPYIDDVVTEQDVNRLDKKTVNRMMDILNK